ncbi:hypothetical protein BU24DRAFT_265087 [Aaosphaeria arxii CBS 175.79]|uniref:Uncharacterized protein n=1 Tax=Aaosphaeria arxii CBS 175.79 TaxID=1450172 RepID=A0A6A5XF37_9PLEO|nr:uncharacterized protein BU24DRAFT_265087 [Aaosphaeria arxii CBS 175.79]KAF2011855.1 hypothetical protein BU24DRAFT_265087 [Aaosphaeria arxii CBS 175.79]
MAFVASTLTEFASMFYPPGWTTLIACLLLAILVELCFRFTMELRYEQVRPGHGTLHIKISKRGYAQFDTISEALDALRDEGERQQEAEKELEETIHEMNAVLNNMRRVIHRNNQAMMRLEAESNSDEHYPMGE